MTPRSALFSSTLVLAAVLVALPTVRAQSTVNLNTWTAEDYAFAGQTAANWSVAMDGLSVTQTVNSTASVFYGDFLAFDGMVSGSITPTSGADDDFIGFVLGFQPGDATNTAAEYLLIDWKKSTQSFNFANDCVGSTNAPAGLAVSRVNGIPVMNEFWGHLDADVSCSALGQGVTELARGATLGATGWVTGQTYDFVFELTATTLDVWVDGTLEIAITGSFQDGRVGFYNFSQQGVLYEAFSFVCNDLAEANPYGGPHTGSGGVADLDALSAPVLGDMMTLTASNTSNDEKFACLVTSPAPMSFSHPSIAFEVLVDYDHPDAELITVLMPAAGWSEVVAVPDDPTLCGALVYLQMYQWDSGLGDWMASNGLELLFGEDLPVAN